MPLYDSALDTDLFKVWEAERRSLTGPSITYYSQRRGAAVDPLYGEQAPSFTYRAGFPVVGSFRLVEFDAESPDVEDNGFLDRWEAELAIAFNAWDAAAPAEVAPKEGDVVVVFGNAYDIDKASAIGEALNVDVHTGWKLMLKRNLEFDPVRKVT